MLEDCCAPAESGVDSSDSGEEGKCTCGGFLGDMAKISRFKLAQCEADWLCGVSLESLVWIE